MKSLRTVPLHVKLPALILAFGLVSALATGALVIHDVRGGPAGPSTIGYVPAIGYPLLLAGLGLCVAAYLSARALTAPLLRVTSAMARIAGGETGVEIPEADRSDEIGLIATALGSLRDDLAGKEAIVAGKAAIIDAIASTQGMIEFDPRGRILRASQNLLDVMGYAEAEVIGRQHSMFVDDVVAASPEYRRMWDSLAAGLPHAGTFSRVARDGRRVYLRGAYSPVRDATGTVVKVVKVASDVTAAEIKRRRLEAESEEQAAIIEAISGGLHGMIEFDTRGKVLRANQTLLDLLGYTADEIVGRMQSGFCEPDFAESAEYRRMWEQLASGQALRGTFKRIAKSGRTVYLQGTYSPVRDRNGTVVRVVKVASDVTAAETERLEAIGRREAMEAEQRRVVDQLSSSLAALAGGDLTDRIASSFAPEYETLRGNYNDAVEKLEGTLSAVVIAAENIRNESSQVTQAADDLSHRTENQAAALEETAASLEELTASVKAAAAGAEKASADVAATRQSAEESGRIVRDAVDAMSEIERSSQHISQIIGVIDDIAFQTNLLALNAGVEAARAGEAGRGFAVVASEVRALAQRSSDAAKEIKALISTSSQQVGRGVDLVGETGKSLQRIVESVTGVAALMAEIANSAREQSVGLSEINTAVNQLDQVTQQNAAMVEESTAVSHAMKSEAESLSDLVAQFKADLARAAIAGPAHPARMPARALEARKSAKPAARGVGHSGRALALKRKSTIDEWEEF